MDAIKLIKRVVLTALTLLAVFLVGTSLVQSFNQPQVQSRLELYQTNLLLHVAEYQGEYPNDPAVQIVQALAGEKPLEAALKQYQEAVASTEEAIATQSSRLSSTVILPPDESSDPPLIEGINSPELAKLKIQEQISHQETLRDELLLRLGILKASQGNLEQAIETWTPLAERSSPHLQPTANTADLLLTLWQDSPTLPPNSEELLTQNLDGWFRYQAFRQLYQIQGQDEALNRLTLEEQERATESLGKLATVTGIPAFGFVVGVGLLIFLGIQWILNRKDSLLVQNGDRTWETPWDWETIWQVFIVGFFFLGQVLVPIVVQLVGIQSAILDVRSRAFYILATYIAIAIGGLLVLFFSIRSFFPLAKDWFRFNVLQASWISWGFGGYFAALPLVILVSIINQQFWQGRGGSNPILSIALENRDTVALTIFFITASVAAPIFEEIMFRGFLLPSLTRYIPVSGAIIASSLLFALAHLNLSEVLPLATLGMVLGFVYTRSRNLLSSILLHSLWNSGTLFSLFVLGSGGS
ncbi:CPBP family intramembrane glutamic endopeptidase [Laspinema olomoucense]|uniref:CPBP family intramembrane glutamic endopeptidase n=1 Tax=Laspinema olomoucense TaxID=3231600 RepID=UPI0021BAEAC9|nr:CPBP family intramembrane glutamic endopeptidase [Laspinema sp. D3d]MCT7973987.1 CPBP family intramembrane metalloprotease [Laspinema sp. D3d]